MSLIRAGILGCGGIAHKHAQALAELDEEVELVALCGTSKARVRAFAAQEKIEHAAVFTDFRKMFDQADLDLVVVCLPPFAHSDEVERAAARGVHVPIEKPIALTSEHAWRMAEAAEHANIKTQVGFMYRFGAAVDALRARISPNTVGMFSARYFCNSLHAPWWRVREKSGGQLLEQLIHLVDLQRYLVGEPVTVTSRQSNFFHRDVPGYTIEDVSATVFGFSGGALGVIYATNGAIPNQWIKEWHAITRELVAEFTDWNHATFTPTDAPSRALEVIASDQNVFLLQLRDLLNAIRTGGDTRTPLREGAKSLDLALATMRSAEQHKEISL